jgi:uncharacterized protein (TIGR02145 family)
MNKTKGLFFTASLVLALTLTQSCSGDDGGGGGGGTFSYCLINEQCLDGPYTASDCGDFGGIASNNCPYNGGGGGSSSGGGGNPSSSSGGSQGGGSNCPADFGEVRIGSQTWAKKNLNCDVAGSKCYGNDPANCTKYGRLYNWVTAMALPSSCTSNSCSGQIQAKHGGICPTGWHIPSDADWNTLVTTAGGDNVAGAKLKTTNSWQGTNGNGNGTDQYGFSALPGGSETSGGSSVLVGSSGYWWSANEDGDNSSYAHFRGISYDFDKVYSETYYKSHLRSIRCIKD